MNGRNGFLLLSFLTLLAAPISVEGSTRYVVHNSYGIPEDPGGAYLSPLTPAHSIQAALDVAETGDTVLVSGIDFNDFESFGFRFDETIRIPQGVSVLGGWDADVAVGGGGNQFDIDSLWTVITRPINEQAVIFDYDSTIVQVETTIVDIDTTFDTTYAFSGPDESTLFRGFYLREIIANQSDGAGVFVRAGSPRIERNIFFNCQSGGARGAALFVGEGSPTIVHNTFAFCRASPEAGILHVESGNPLIRDNIFRKTSAGFAIYCGDSQGGDVTYNVFSDNGEGRDFFGCEPDSITNLFDTAPVFCGEPNDYRLFIESPIRDAASDGTAIGAWEVGCRAGTKYVSVSGGDVFPFSVPANAARTIEEAVNIAAPGDTIRVASGEYFTNLVISEEMVLLGGFSPGFEQDGPDPSLSGTVLFPIDPNEAVIRIDGTGGPFTASFLVLTGAPDIDGALVRVEGGTSLFKHISVVGNETFTPSNALIQAENGSSVQFEFSLFASNTGGAVFGCSGGATVELRSSNLYGNDDDFLGGCLPTLIDSSSLNPFFCDAEVGDYRMFSESGLDDIAPGSFPIGALGAGCNLSTHYVVPGDQEGTFPYATPEDATSDFQKIAGVAGAQDTVRIAAGTYDANVTMTGGAFLQGGWTDNQFTERVASPSNTILRGIGEGEPTVHFTVGNSILVPRGGVEGCVITHADGVSGPGIAVSSTARPLIRNNLVVGNRVDRATHPEWRAAGIDVQGNDNSKNAIPFIIQNTIVNNTISSEPGEPAGGGFYVEFGGLNNDNRVRFLMNVVALNEGGMGGLVFNELSKDVNQNVVKGNQDSTGQEKNIVVLSGRIPARNNIEEDPDFADSENLDFRISTCSPAADDTFSCTGDTVAGALPISPTAICDDEVFLANATAPESHFPFRCKRNASRTISAISPHLSAGDTVKVSQGSYSDQFDLVSGVSYKGGYAVNDFTEDTRIFFRSRFTGGNSRRIITAGNGVDSTTIIEGFQFEDGKADSGGIMLITGDASPTIIDNLFNNGRSESEGAIFFATDGSRPRFERNLIVESGTSEEDGSLVYLGGAGGRFANNTITRNSINSWAIRVVDSAPQIYNNSITFNGKGVQARGGTGIEFDHNNVFQNRGFDCDLDFAVCLPDPAADSTNISDNPRYCNPGLDFRIFDHSPNILAGRNGTNIGAYDVGCKTAIHFVNPNGSNEYPYDRADKAAHRIQDAIDVAAMAGISSGDSIDAVNIVAGTYFENITLPSNVQLLGGFPLVGTGRDPAVHITIIDGGGNGSVIEIDDEAVGSTLLLNRPNATMVDGIRITGGSDSLGGGIRIGAGAEPTIRNNHIFGNTAILGGAAFVSKGASPRFSQNLVSDNTAERGAGLYIDSVSSPVLSRYESNTFYANNATGEGAGVIETEGANVLIQRNIVAFSEGGAGYATTQEVGANISDNLFFQNPGGDSLVLSAQANPVHVIADPSFCDPGNGDFGLLYSLREIQAGRSALRDSCARSWWGARGAGCTEPGHRFLVRKTVSSDIPVFPHVCKENASPTIAGVLAVVSPGDTVEVARPDTAFPYIENLVLREPIVMRGGWNEGFSNLPDPANPDSTAPNPRLTNTRTIIRGAGNGPVLTIAMRTDTEAGDMSHLIDSLTIIEGLEFRSGTAQTTNGGGIRVIQGASPTIRDCAFRANQTENWGGGISITGATSPRIYSNYIFKNRAGIGGGIYIFDTSDPVIRGNIISSNTAVEYGGIRMEQVTGGSVDNNVFFRNAAGGISLSEPEGELHIFNNVVTNNGGFGLSLFPHFAGVRLPEYSHNNVWANGGGNYQNLPPSSDDLSGDPQFCNTDQRWDFASGQLNPRFFRYQECSPTLFSGIDSSADLDAHIGVASASDPICPDTTAPDLTMGVLLHTSISGVANFHIVPDEGLARDSISLDLLYGEFVEVVDSNGVVLGDTVDFDTVNVPLRLQAGGLSVYSSDNVALETSDSLVVKVRAVDRCGVVGFVNRLFSSTLFLKGEGGRVRSSDRLITIAALPGAIGRSGAVLMEVVDAGGGEAPDGSSVLSSAYRVNFSQVNPTQPLHLTAPTDRFDLEKDQLTHLSIYRRVEDEWERIESTIDPVRADVTAEIEGSGTYALRYSKSAVSEEVVPKLFALYANAPNPFNPVTRILFDLPERQDVTLRVYDVRGRLVKTLLTGVQKAGRHEAAWRGTDESGRSAGSGVYFYRLESGEQTATRKMILVR